MGRQSSLIFDVCLRFDELRAIGVSRHAEKRRLRVANGEYGASWSTRARSTGRIHSFKSEVTYKGIALRYARWARTVHNVRTLAALDADAATFVTLYLEARDTAGDRPATVKTIRSALRLFHGAAYPLAERAERVTCLGHDVAVPARRREEIVRSRGPVAMDAALALDRYRDLVGFCRATGLRRRELVALTVGHVRADEDGALVVDVHNGKGGKERVAPVVPGREADVLALVRDRPADARVVERVPVRLDVQAYRRLYAQDLYCEDGVRTLPPTASRLPAGTVDRERALIVARALGHARVDVVLRHYLR